MRPDSVPWSCLGTFVFLGTRGHGRCRSGAANCGCERAHVPGPVQTPRSVWVAAAQESSPSVLGGRPRGPRGAFVLESGGDDPGRGPLSQSLISPRNELLQPTLLAARGHAGGRRKLITYKKGPPQAP